jgi:predicted RNA binding protein YcfA (HicA-like mRNA interferase family)
VSKVPSLNYQVIVNALLRGGWSHARQRGSHIRLIKKLDGETLFVTVPAHKPVKRSTLSHILKQARLSVDEFMELT